MRKQSDAERSKRNTVHVEQDDGSWKPEMISPDHEPRGNVVLVEQRDGSWKPERISNYR